MLWPTELSSLKKPYAGTGHLKRETHLRLAKPFRQSAHAKELAAAIQWSVHGSPDNIKKKVEEAVVDIAISIGIFIKFKCEDISVKSDRTYRAEMRRYGKLIKSWASKIEKMPQSVFGQLTFSRVFDDEVDQTANATWPVDKYDLRGIGLLLEQCSDTLICRATSKKRRPGLEYEGHLFEKVMEQWEKVTGRLADGTKKANAIARDGLPAFRNTAELVRNYINNGPGKDCGIKITTENMNTVIDKILKIRREHMRSSVIPLVFRKKN